MITKKRRKCQKFVMERYGNMEIKREFYLNELITRMDNGLIKIVTGIRRCGKSYLLDPIFKDYLIEQGIDKEHIIKLSLVQNVLFVKIFSEK